jgi:hypothetical protein
MYDDRVAWLAGEFLDPDVHAVDDHADVKLGAFDLG